MYLCINTMYFHLAALLVGLKENLGGVGFCGGILLMARMMSIRLVGQMSSFARWEDGGWVHSGMGRIAIGSDGVADVGIVVCHSSMVMTFICGDGCSDEAVVDCHQGVDISVICGDDVCVSVHLSVE